MPVGRIDEVVFPITNGTLDDGLLGPPEVREERDRDPVLVGPVEVVEYGAEDEMVPPARLEELGWLTIPVGP